MRSLYRTFSCSILMIHLIVASAGEMPNIDYGKDNPYPETQSAIVEILLESKDGTARYRHFYRAVEMPLADITDLIRRRNNVVVAKAAKVVVLYEKHIPRKYLHSIRNSFSQKNDFSDISFFQRERLRDDLLKFIDLRRKKPATITRKSDNVSIIESDFNRITMKILSLKMELEDAPKRVIDELLEDCRRFLMKHKVQRTHIFYKPAVRLQSKLLQIKKKNIEQEKREQQQDQDAPE